MGARELGAFGGALPEASGAYGFNPPELRAYQPSWRDRLALALQNVLPEQTVEGLMGSRGLGPTQRNAGMGLVDFTPLGIPLAVNEAQKSGEEGDWLGATMNAAAVIPGAKAGAKAIEAGVNEVRQGIRAYHGSPHDFDKFDLSKIGTGEGAQAYGHGLYFAENEDVARSYRSAGYSDRVPIVVGSDRIELDQLPPNSPEWWAAKSIQHAQTTSGGKAVDIDSIRSSWANDKTSDLGPKVAMVLEDWQKRGIKPGGGTYEVSINAHPDEFLDWDKPLSEQSQRVQAAVKDYLTTAQGTVKDSLTVAPSGASAIEASGAEPASQISANLTGGQLYEQGYATRTKPRRQTAIDISEALRAAGIKGIRYKDAGSRGADKAGGTSNYVVFSDDLITILRKYGIAGLTVGGAGGAGFDNGP